jgi:hypothetical protein
MLMHFALQYQYQERVKTGTKNESNVAKALKREAYACFLSNRLDRRSCHAQEVKGYKPASILPTSYRDTNMS